MIFPIDLVWVIKNDKGEEAFPGCKERWDPVQVSLAEGTAKGGLGPQTTLIITEMPTWQSQFGKKVISLHEYRNKVLIEPPVSKKEITVFFNRDATGHPKDIEKKYNGEAAPLNFAPNWVYYWIESCKPFVKKRIDAGRADEDPFTDVTMNYDLGQRDCGKSTYGWESGSPDDIITLGPNAIFASPTNMPATVNIPTTPPSTLYLKSKDAYWSFCFSVAHESSHIALMRKQWWWSDTCYGRPDMDQDDFNDCFELFDYNAHSIYGDYGFDPENNKDVYNSQTYSWIPWKTWDLENNIMKPWLVTQNINSRIEPTVGTRWEEQEANKMAIDKVGNPLENVDKLACPSENKPNCDWSKEGRNWK